MKRIPEKFHGPLIILVISLLLVMAIGLMTFVLPIISATDWSETKRIDGVSRVMMHEPSRYTMLVEKSDGTIAQYSFGGGCCGNVPKIFHDVPSGQPMWIEYRTGDPGKNSAFDQLLTIHVHSVGDINGAGWNHGKFGRGETTVLE